MTKSPTPRLCPGFDPDPELGTDWNGRQICRHCQRPGEPGDPGHTPPPPPTPKELPPAFAAAAQARDAAILGERDREDYR
ncbi:hypothetical protein [Micromonospora sp. RTP1Z1]|uniref:hypothetical protein n=1 Tax=Micromonospora sp. RTP1Z1 TaxID=2994043 RepID=UPI0029C7B20A|nr:hypothetical protein [Micromonospora sp. RTP1Z1]